MSEENKKKTDVNELGEFGLIEHLTEKFPVFHTSTIRAVGDDAAVMYAADQLVLVSTDMLVEGIHFDLAYTPLKHLGYKSVIVNLSDIFAMNGIPRQITVSVAISNRFSVEAMEELYSGILAACKQYRIDLVGGDTTSSNRGLIISVTAIGYTSPELVTYRHGARPGDLICVSGDLGAAYLGLQILEREKSIWREHPGVQPQLDEHQYLIHRQLKPEARADMVDQLRKAGIVPTAMIDISDGLASEIFHICKQSNVGAIIEESGVPIHNDAQLQALEFGMDPITCALSGGEDYELLFTVRPEDEEKIKYLADVYVMGEIRAPEEGVKLRTKGGNIHMLKAQGWRHFEQE
jgi:thiamine-monophosphate kinase